MSEIPQTEEEQIETLKKWWSENGTSLIASIAVALIAVFGWQFWQDQQQAKLEAASAIYQDLLVAAAGTNGVMSSTQRATANHLAEKLKEDYTSSIYAQFGALYKAKFAVSNNELNEAEQELRWVLSNGAEAEMKIQATLRLARVLYAQENYDEALSLLDTDSSGYASAFEEVRGDIYSDQGDLEKANLAYQKALELGQATGAASNSVLNLKVQQLKSLLADAGDA
jgi:predicted negative regulator of RcsB-dependent stress response